MSRVRRETGVALVLLLALIGMVLTGVLLTTARGAIDPNAQDRVTALALGKARDALIARAAVDSNRPGGLPCPDINNSGTAALGGGCPSYIGRLPWRTLGLPDLRDGAGERLWYALTPAFRAHPSGGPINSDTSGQLTVNGLTPTSGVIAIVFAAGAPLGPQIRDVANANTAANYLEADNANGDAVYEQQAPSPGFNDRLLAITPDMFFPLIEKRVAREARLCLQAFAATTGNRLPWAAPITDTTNYADVANTYFGRIPKTLAATVSDLGAVAWPASAQPGITCFAAASWWDSWRSLLFYHVSDAHSPTGSGSCATGTCLAVRSNPNATGVEAVAIVAGRAFSANPAQFSGRSSNPTLVSNYLEIDPATGIDNANGATALIYAKSPQAVLIGTQFNDRVECLQESGAWPC